MPHTKISRTVAATKFDQKRHFERFLFMIWYFYPTLIDFDILEFKEKE